MNFTQNANLDVPVIIGSSTFLNTTRTIITMGKNGIHTPVLKHFLRPEGQLKSRKRTKKKLVTDDDVEKKRKWRCEIGFLFQILIFLDLFFIKRNRLYPVSHRVNVNCDVIKCVYVAQFINYTRKAQAKKYMDFASSLEYNVQQLSMPLQLRVLLLTYCTVRSIVSGSSCLQDNIKWKRTRVLCTVKVKAKWLLAAKDH